jgi:prepilin-type N-terminal cleavage/methylation domain-containing protein
MNKAFTLIELLIVVAIIAILAAIAVPNFLEAQTRSKVSRVHSDLRTLATGIESYAVDNNNKYPFDWDSRGYPWKLTDALSTPVAYLTQSSSMNDVFRDKNNVAEDAKRYRYLNYIANFAPGWLPCPYPGPYRTRWDTTDYTAGSRLGMEAFGMWKLSSSGPDKVPNTGFFATELAYDATNGTISGGDILRSQKKGISGR